MAASNNNNQQGQQNQQADTTAVTTQDAIGPDFLASVGWNVISGFASDTEGFIIDGSPTWGRVREAELAQFTQDPNMQGTAAGATTGVQLDNMPVNAVGIVRAAHSDIMENNFETYYTLRPIDITFPSFQWSWNPTENNPTYIAWFTYSAAEKAGLIARSGDPISGLFGADAIDYKLKSKHQTFLEELSTSTVGNQTINPKITYNDMRVINATGIRGTQQRAQTLIDQASETLPASYSDETGTY